MRSQILDKLTCTRWLVLLTFVIPNSVTAAHRADQVAATESGRLILLEDDGERQIAFHRGAGVAPVTLARVTADLSAAVLADAVGVTFATWTTTGPPVNAACETGRMQNAGPAAPAHSCGTGVGGGPT